MRHVVSVLVAGLCAAAGATQPVPVEFGQAFSLMAGQTAQTRNGDWCVGFDRVTADSRCPKGVQCVWAGDAVVRIWLQRGSGPRELRELHTANVGSRERAAPGLRLTRLDPLPVVGRDIAPQDYVATLVLTEGPADEAER